MPHVRLRDCFRFSLRTMFVIGTLAGIPLLRLVRERAQSEHERRVAEQLEPLRTHSSPWHEMHFKHESWWHAPLDFICGPRVTAIELGGVSFKDPARLAGLTSMEMLTLEGTSSADLRLLPKLPRLNWIGLKRVAVVDLAPLAEIKTLEYVSLEETKSSDLSPLARLPKLRLLYISDCPVTDLSPIAEMNSLESLFVSVPTVTDLKPLRGKNLSPLIVGYCDVSVAEEQALRQSLPNCTIDLFRR